MNGYRKSPACKPLKAQVRDFLCPEAFFYSDAEFS